MQNSDGPSLNSFRSFIEQVVVTFYQKATTDFLIGYHFRHIHDFDTHIPRIVDFWEIHLLPGLHVSERAKKAEPFQLINIHRPLIIKKGEVGRWIILFQQTLEETDQHELKEKWLSKLEFFRNVFLNSKELF